jgi:NhaA family Na+:H+ antiporter
MIRLPRFVVDHLLLLPIGAAIALVWSNVHPESYFTFTYVIAFGVNDVAMAFFFGLIVKEVIEATARGGVLHPWRRATLPVIAAVGAVFVPALLYGPAASAVGEPMLGRGWLAPSAVDIAFAYFMARMIFGAKHPAIPFVLLLSIASDAIVLGTAAFLYPTRELHPAAGGIVMAAALGTAAAMRYEGVRSFWPYLVISGGLSWLGLYLAGIAPALALVPVLPFLRHAARDPGFFVDAPPRAHDALNEFEKWWRYPVHVSLFFFGLVNGAVQLGALESGIWQLPIVILGGKTAGVLAGVALAMVAGLHLPARIGWRDLTVVGVITSIAFSVGLFLAGTAMGPGQLLTETRWIVLLGLLAAPMALLLARVLRVGRFSHEGVRKRRSGSHTEKDPWPHHHVSHL